MTSSWEPALARLTQALLTVAVVIANIIGTAVVFVAAVWVLPTPPVADVGQVRLVNLVAAGIYVAVAVPVGIVWGNFALRAALAVAREQRAPTETERRVVLRGPVSIGLRMAVLWAVAAVVFGVLNLRYSGLLAFEVAITVALAGVTTSAVGYLAYRAPAAPDNRSGSPGRRSRTTRGAGSGGACGAGLGARHRGPRARRDARRAVHACRGRHNRARAGDHRARPRRVALVIGLLVTLLAARAAADPVLSVRDALARVEEGELDVEVAVYDGTEVGLLQVGFNRMVAGLRDRDRIREAFGTYVDRDVAEHILEEEPRSTARRSR